jgi:hypothetical protein
VDMSLCSFLIPYIYLSFHFVLLYSRHHIPGQNHDKTIANRSSENVIEFKYLATPETNQNLIQEQNKRRMK